VFQDKKLVRLVVVIGTHGINNEDRVSQSDCRMMGKKNIALLRRFLGRTMIGVYL